MSYYTSPVTAFGHHAVTSSLTAYPGALSTEPRPVKTSDPSGRFFHVTDACRYLMI
jgi:hypothetical protein